MIKIIVLYLFLFFCIIPSIFYKKTKKLLTLNVGYYMLGGDFVKEANKNMEIICRKILNKISSYDVDIICTQEDLLVTNSFYPIFENIYKEYGYKVINYCESHPKLIKEKYIIENYGTAKLGNVIYSRDKNVIKGINIPDLDVGHKGCNIKPRCATSILLNGIKIYNTHLCGGRFDDKDVVEKNVSIDARDNQVKNMINMGADIILGDLNAGYSDDYRFARSLSKNFDKDNFRRWREGVIEYLFENGYKSAYQNYKNSETTIRGKYVVDWVFYKNVNIGKVEIIKFWGDTEMLADHHGILVEIIF